MLVIDAIGQYLVVYFWPDFKFKKGSIRF